MRSNAAMQAEYCHSTIHLTLTGSCPPVSHYSDTHSVLPAGSQSRLCHQYWKASWCCGTQGGKVFFFVSSVDFDLVMRPDSEL